MIVFHTIRDENTASACVFLSLVALHHGWVRQVHLGNPVLLYERLGDPKAWDFSDFSDDSPILNGSVFTCSGHVVSYGIWGDFWSGPLDALSLGKCGVSDFSDFHLNKWFHDLKQPQQKERLSILGATLKKIKNNHFGIQEKWIYYRLQPFCL